MKLHFLNKKAYCLKRNWVLQSWNNHISNVKTVIKLKFKGTANSPKLKIKPSILTVTTTSHRINSLDLVTLLPHSQLADSWTGNAIHATQLRPASSNQNSSDINNKSTNKKTHINTHRFFVVFNYKKKQHEPITTLITHYHGQVF